MDVSHVEVEGQRFYSDRFYLNAPAGYRRSSANCPSHNASQLFDRAKLISSIDLKAAIVGTYVLDYQWLWQEIPKLFPSPIIEQDDTCSTGTPFCLMQISSTEHRETETSNQLCKGMQDATCEAVPTLVLHGDKGLRVNTSLDETRRKFDQPTKKRGPPAHHERDSLDSMISTGSKKQTFAKGTFAFGDIREKQKTLRKACERSSLNQKLNIPTGCSNGKSVSAFIDHKIPAKALNSLNQTSSSVKIVSSEGVEVIVLDDSPSDNTDQDTGAEEHTTVERFVLQSATETIIQNYRRHSTLAAKQSIEANYDPVYQNFPEVHNTDDDEDVDNWPSSREPCNIKMELSDEDIPPEERWMRSSRRIELKKIRQGKTGLLPYSNEDRPLFGPSVYLSEVLSKWIPHLAPLNECINDRVEQYGKTSAEENVITIIESSDEEDNLVQAAESSRTGMPSPVCNANFRVNSSGMQHSSSTSSVNRNVLRRRKSCKGVHHPKFLLLFEKCGSIVVVISTANLTRPRSVDGSWIQRFEARPAGTNASAEVVGDEMIHDGRDFGWVLADFLKKQGEALRQSHMLPTEFMQRYLNFSDLDVFRRHFLFERADVHLIATVPGNRDGRLGTTHLGGFGGIDTRRFLYGPQRVGDILNNLQEKRPANLNFAKHPFCSTWLPCTVISRDDRIIMQTTSFGANWSRQGLQEIACSYLGINNDLRYNLTGENCTISDEMVERAIEQVDILWPSLDFMDMRRKNAGDKHEPASIEKDGAIAVHGHFAFLSSKSFNTIDLDCISRMSLFEYCCPSISPLLSPHIKSFGRLLRAESKKVNDEIMLDRAGGLDYRNTKDERFAWFMLTSACLSHGAQGVAVEHRGFERDTMRYANFELGVLFCSRLQGKESDRLYVADSSHSKVLSGQGECISPDVKMGNVRHIRLPIPYKLQAKPYQSNPYEADMWATPFFHEISPGTGGAGKMGLTPLGKRLAEVHE